MKSPLINSNRPIKIKIPTSGKTGQKWGTQRLHLRIRGVMLEIYGG